MVTKVRLTSYKSIPTSSVVLGALTFLVGRNGAGKSNFIDALEFIHDAVDTNLDAAIRAHGSPGSIRRVGSTYPFRSRRQPEAGVTRARQ